METGIMGRTGLLIAALLCLVLPATQAQGQVALWQTQMAAGGSAARQGNLGEARARYETALEATADFEALDPRRGLTLNALAGVLAEAGEAGQAEPLLVQALGVWRASGGPGELHLAQALDELGRIYAARGRSQEARHALQQAVTLREQSLPAGHPALVDTRAALAALPGAEDDAGRAVDWPEAPDQGAETIPTALMAPAAVAKPVTGAEIDVTRVTLVAGAGDDFAVHLASLRSAEDARKEWRRLQRAYPELLGDMSLAVEEIELGEQGVFHRVLALPFPNKATALDICVQLLSEKQFCQVVSYVEAG
jgi:tetratricopeptide (TPR) repeat protein